MSKVTDVEVSAFSECFLCFTFFLSGGEGGVYPKKLRQ